MEYWKNDKEYMDLVKDILNIDEFQQLKNYKHHGDNRLNHCIRASYKSYKVTKKLKLRYKEVARAALLHDFFLVNNQEISIFERIKVLIIHPSIAVTNAKKYVELNKFEENIIRSHMFPVNPTLPRYFESVLVDLIDDYVSIYERRFTIKNSIVKLFNRK